MMYQEIQITGLTSTVAQAVVTAIYGLNNRGVLLIPTAYIPSTSTLWMCVFGPSIHGFLILLRDTLFTRLGRIADVDISRGSYEDVSPSVRCKR